MTSIVHPIRREVDVYVAVSRGREIARQAGFDEIDRTRLEIVILELTRNILVHAGAGEIQISDVERSGRRGVQVEARDSGPGIADLELAMRDGYSTAHTLGAGLPGVRRLMDEFAIETAPDAGTTVRAIRWVPAPRGGRR
ncbi:MAG TPA: anti-sigma regulatory factor [Herpetosiphonaceae bacterium]